MMQIIFIFLLFISAAIAQENQIDSYNLGEGTQIGKLPIYLGGYFSTDYRNMNGDNRYRMDDIALLSYGNYKKFSYMAEFEYKDFYILSENGGKYSTQKNTSLHTERLFVDYNMDENYLLRVGKYNSPIGYWNLLPINVLRDTTSSPISTTILFPKFTTGAMASYSTYGKGNFKLNVMLQHNNDLDFNYNNYNIDEHYGLGLVYERDTWSFKLNLGEFDGLFVNNKSQTLYYYMASAKYETEKFQIMSEIGSQKSAKKYTTRYAGYLQGLYHINEKHAAVMRLVSIKTEYQLHSIKKNNQFLLSLSVLF